MPLPYRAPSHAVHLRVTTPPRNGAPGDRNVLDLMRRKRCFQATALRAGVGG
jgi:hypothetical protein